MPRKGFMLTSHLVMKCIKKVCTQKLRINKINFYRLIKNILKWNWLWFYNGFLTFVSFTVIFWQFGATA